MESKFGLRFYLLCLCVILSFGCATIRLPDRVAQLEEKITQLEDESLMEMAAGVGVATKHYGRDCIDGSCAAGYDLDDIVGMADGDVAIVPKDPTYGYLYYIYDDPSSLGDSPPGVIAPDAGSGEWIRKTVYIAANEIKLDDVGNPDANVSLDMGSFTLALNGSTANCVFSDGTLTCGEFVSSGTPPQFTCVGADSEDDIDTAGEFCNDSSEDGSEWDDIGDYPFYFYDAGGTLRAVVSTDQAQTFEKKTIDTTSGANANIITTTVTEFIKAKDMEDGSEEPDTIATVCDGNPLATGFRTFDHAQSEDIRFAWHAPHDLDAGAGVKIQLVLLQSAATVNSPAADEGMAWNLMGCSISGNEDFDCTGGASNESIDDADLSGDTNALCDLWYSAQSTALTSTNITGLAAGELVKIVMQRDHDDPDDDYGQMIGLVGAILEYKLVKDNTF